MAVRPWRNDSDTTANGVATGVEQWKTLRNFEPVRFSPGFEIDGQTDIVRPHARLIDSVRYLINTRGLAGADDVPQSIGVTSALRGEGTTSISHALATVLTEDFDAWVCWVDLSWARESSPASSDHPGLFDIFSGDIDLGAAFGVNGEVGYVVLEAGTVPERSRHALIRSAGLDAFISVLRSEFEYVVFDLPPALGTNAGLPVFNFVDAYALVAQAGVVHADQLEQTVERLSEIPHLGTILNRQTDRVPGFFRRLLTG